MSAVDELKELGLDTQGNSLLSGKRIVMSAADELAELGLDTQGRSLVNPRSLVPAPGLFPDQAPVPDISRVEIPQPRRQATIGAVDPLQAALRQTPEQQFQQAPGFMSILNPESEFFEKTPEEQQRARLALKFLSPTAIEEATGEVITPHELPFGKVQGAVRSGIGGFLGAEQEPIQGSSEGLNLAANLAGEAAKYVGLIKAAGAAGLRGTLAETAAGLTSGAVRQAASEEPSLQGLLFEGILAGGGSALVRSLAAGLKSPTIGAVTPKAPTKPPIVPPERPVVPTQRVIPTIEELAAPSLVPRVQRRFPTLEPPEQVVTPKPVEPVPKAPIKKPTGVEPVKPKVEAKPVTDLLEEAKRPVVTKITPIKPAEPSPAIGLKKAEIEKIRADFDIKDLDPVRKKSFETSVSQAKAEGLDKSALEVADAAIGSGRAVTDAEHAGMALKATELANDYEKALKAMSREFDKGDNIVAFEMRAEAEALLENIEKLTTASDQAGTAAARTLSIRRMMINRESYKIAHVMQRAKATKGAKLTPAEQTKFQKIVGKNSQLEDEVAKLEAKYEKIAGDKDKLAAELLAQREIAKAKITSRARKSKESLQAQRQDIKKQLGALGHRLNDISGVTAEGAYLVGRLAVNYIRSGAVTLDEVVRKVIADLPDLTERDVWKSLNARDPKLQAKAKTATEQRVTQLKTQGKLLDDIASAEEGVFGKAKKRPTQPTDIKQLRKKLRDLRAEAYRSGISSEKLERSIQTINELQDQLDNQFRLLKKNKPIESAELQAVKEKVRLLRKTMRVEDDLAKAKEQLRTGEFELSPEQRIKPVPLELEKKQIALQRARKDIRVAIDELAPITGRKLFGEAANTLRTLKATADMSGTLRQGLVLSVTRPKLAARTFGKSFKAFFSQNSAETIDASIKASPIHYLRDRAKLYLAPLGEGTLSAREEAFSARWLQKIPALGRVIKASERHMVSHLNLLRVGAFDDFVRRYPNATRQELTAWADWINVATGRGDLGSLRQAANHLSLVVFAPRFAASRIQTPFRILRSLKHPRVRKEIAKDMVGTVGLGMTALTLASMAGLDVSIDPRSPDFGKIRIGNTRIDIWAGFQQPARLIARIGASVTDRTRLTGKGLTKAQRETDPLEMIYRFAAFKLAPSVAVPLEFLKGKSIVGEKRTPLRTAASAVMPLVYEDMFDAFKEAGFGRAALSTGLGFFGVAVNTYKRRKRIPAFR